MASEKPVLAVRPERVTDLEDVYEVASLAFRTTKEADLIDHLRPFNEQFISLVTLVDGQIVGHLLFNPVTVGKAKATALGVLAMKPDHQRQGVGSRLVKIGLAACEKQGESVVFVLGRRAYYPRFGFELAAPKGLYYRVPGPSPSFFVKELVAGASRTLTGEVRYPNAFYD